MDKMPCTPETCENCIYIGEGDFMCDADDTPRIVLADFEPTEDFFWCNGSEWEDSDEDTTDIQ
jgi:hypothetical protein